MTQQPRYPWQQKFADPEVLADLAQERAANQDLLGKLFRIIQCSGNAQEVRQIASRAIAEAASRRLIGKDSPAGLHPLPALPERGGEAV